MTGNQWLAIVCAAAIVPCVITTALMLLREARYRDLKTHVVAVTTGFAAEPRQAPSGRPDDFLKWIGNLIKGSRLYSRKDLTSMEAMIAASGLNPRRALPILLGGKVVLMLVVPAVAGIYCYLAGPAPANQAMIIGASLPAGLLCPEWILSLLRRPYTRALQRGVIDALDLLVVCSEAGLGLESALERVTREMTHSNRPTAATLTRLLDDIRVLPDRREAFSNFAKQSGVEGMQRLATILAQSQQYGTPLGQALRAVAVELRRNRMVKLEERAAKLPAKLVLPLILFIMPCLIIVLVGSSFLRLFDALASLTH